jgi:hypothetical protein
MQPSPSLGPPLLSTSWSPPPWGISVPAGQPFAFVAGGVVVFVLVVAGAVFDGVFEEPHAVSAPTAITDKTRSVTSGRIKRFLTSSPLLWHVVELTYAAVSKTDSSRLRMKHRVRGSGRA